MKLKNKIFNNDDDVFAVMRNNSSRTKEAESIENAVILSSVHGVAQLTLGCLEHVLLRCAGKFV